ncbi:hypothetical protein MHYP_G00275140 [Metynnis hypsauchen]
MHAVRSESGHLVSEPSEIRQQTVGFFSMLFESEQDSSRDVEKRFFPLQAKIAQQSATLLDPELSLGELYEALQGMEKGRAPGIDGLLVECYKAFWSVLGQDVLEVLRVSVREGKLPLSCRTAVLTLMPKKGDLAVLKNWCPVALLCTDCKLLSKALASRLGKNLSSF